MGADCLLEQGGADSLRENVIQIPVHLHDGANAVAACVIDGYGQLKSKLPRASEPDHTRIHRPGSLARAAAVIASLKGQFDERNQSIEWRTQTDILHERLQILKTIFDGEAHAESIGRGGITG